MQDEYKIGSLFSGIGGIELGFEWQGFETAWYVENNPYCQAVIRKRKPSAIIYGNIEEVDFSAVPKVGILTGGFPCQDISNAGKRAGIKGSRSSLWKHFCRAIGEMRPNFAVIENVAALAGRGLDVVLCGLAEIGYDAEWYNISASSVGALHRRERLFIIAYPHTAGQQDRSKQHWGEQAQKREGFSSISGCGSVSYPPELGCDNRGDNREGGQILPAEVRASKENQQAGDRRGCWAGKVCEDVPYSKSNGLYGGGDIKDIPDQNRELLHSEEKIGSEIRGETERCLRNIGQGYWAVEPGLGRVAYGVPNRVDRIKCLGNAVVPQCAEVIARAIKERIEGEENRE